MVGLHGNTGPCYVPGLVRERAEKVRIDRTRFRARQGDKESLVVEHHGKRKEEQDRPDITFCTCPAGMDERPQVRFRSTVRIIEGSLE